MKNQTKKILFVGIAAFAFLLIVPVAEQKKDSDPPVIKTPGNVTLNKGSFFNPMEGVIAYDMDDYSVDREDVVVDGTIDTNTPGIYKLIYRVADTSGNTAKSERTITVEQISEDISAGNKPDITIPIATIDPIVTDGISRTYSIIVRFNETVRMEYNANDFEPIREFLSIGPNRDESRYIVGEDNDIVVNSFGWSLETMDSFPIDENGRDNRDILNKGFKKIRILLKAYKGTNEAPDNHVEGGGFTFTENGKIKIKLDRVKDIAGNSLDGAIVETTVTVKP